MMASRQVDIWCFMEVKVSDRDTRWSGLWNVFNRAGFELIAGSTDTDMALVLLALRHEKVHEYTIAIKTPRTVGAYLKLHNGSVLTAIGHYGPSRPTFDHAQAHYAELRDLLLTTREMGGPVVFGGDHNVALRPEDGSISAHPASHIFANLMEELAWSDVEDVIPNAAGTTRAHTWFKPGHDGVSSRIDHIWVSGRARHSVVRWTTHGEAGGTDHSPLTITLDCIGHQPAPTPTTQRPTPPLKFPRFDDKRWASFGDQVYRKLPVLPRAWSPELIDNTVLAITTALSEADEQFRKPTALTRKKYENNAIKKLH